MKKNIFKSILITNFIVVIFMVIFLYIITNIEMNYASNANEYETGRYTYIESGKGFEESLSTVEGDDRFFQEGQVLALIGCSSSLFPIRSIAYSIIFSTIIGIGIGYLITIVDNSQNIGSIVKKMIVAYLIGLLLSTGIFTLIDKLEYNQINPPEILTIAISWTVIFFVSLLSKRALDNNKAKKLENLLKKQ